MTGPAATLSTHVLDAVSGRPAAGMALTLERRSDAGWTAVGQSATDADGRCAELAREGLSTGIWRLVFDTGSYFSAAGARAFYPEVCVVFEVTEPGHHHVPLLLSPFAYSTYRGS
jgi:5-hydroxyisourate hydrolase